MGKGGKGSDRKGWHKMSYSVKVFPAFDFPGLVHSPVENSQRPCASIGNSRKKGNTIFLFARV